MNKVGNHGFLKLISTSEMSTKENTLQLPTQFSSTSCSESESGTEYSNLKKQRKYRKENDVPLSFLNKRKIIRSLNGMYS